MFRAAMGHFLVHFLGYSLILERKAPENKFRRLLEQFRQAAQLFFALFFSKRYSLFTATHFLRHPFSHAVQIICYSQTQSTQTLSSTDDFVGQV